MTDKKSIIEKTADYVISFFIYSVVIWIFNGISGWLVAPQEGFDGGILYGPYSPFYAFLVMGVMFAFNAMKEWGKKKNINPTVILLILMSFIIFLAMEYLGSLVLELIMGEKPWDYSANIFSINGRMSLENAVFLSIFEIICVYIAQPFLSRITEKMWISARLIIAMSVIVVILTDIICTFMK